MRSGASLDELFEQAAASHQAEVDFFRALLVEQVYVHVPKPGRARDGQLVSFRHPDGFDAVPIFTSIERARMAAGALVHVASARGKKILQGAPTATYMINPRDGGPVLYPEEVRALVESGFIAEVSTSQLPANREVEIKRIAIPDGLELCLLTYFEKNPDVERVGVAQLFVNGEDVPRIVVALGVPPVIAERAARALCLLVQQQDLFEFDMPIDVATFDSTQALSDPWSDPDITWLDRTQVMAKH